MDYFGEFAYLGSPVSNRLSGIRTSQIEPSYTWNTVDNPFNPSRGTYFTGGVRMAGPGGAIVNLIEPSLEAKHYRRGIRRRDVIAFRVRGRVIRGFRGRVRRPSTAISWAAKTIFEDSAIGPQALSLSCRIE